MALQLCGARPVVPHLPLAVGKKSRRSAARRLIYSYPVAVKFQTRHERTRCMCSRRKLPSPLIQQLSMYLGTTSAARLFPHDMSVTRDQLFRCRSLTVPVTTTKRSKTERERSRSTHTDRHIEHTVSIATISQEPSLRHDSASPCGLNDPNSSFCRLPPAL